MNFGGEYLYKSPNPFPKFFQNLPLPRLYIYYFFKIKKPEGSNPIKAKNLHASSLRYANVFQDKSKDIYINDIMIKK